MMISWLLMMLIMILNDLRPVAVYSFYRNMSKGSVYLLFTVVPVSSRRQNHHFQALFCWWTQWVRGCRDPGWLCLDRHAVQRCRITNINIVLSANLVLKSQETAVVSWRQICFLGRFPPPLPKLCSCGALPPSSTNCFYSSKANV